MRNFKRTLFSAGLGATLLSVGAMNSAVAEVGFGKPGEAVDLVVGYQPYYTES